MRPELLWTNPHVGFNQNETGGFLGPMIGTFLVAAIAIAIAGAGGRRGGRLAERVRASGGARAARRNRPWRCSPGRRRWCWRCSAILLFETHALGFLSEINGGVVFGKSFFAAGAMLSLVALPLVVSTVREGLQAIPNHVREASYARRQDEDRDDPARAAAGGAAVGDHRATCSGSAT